MRKHNADRCQTSLNQGLETIAVEPIIGYFRSNEAAESRVFDPFAALGLAD